MNTTIQAIAWAIAIIATAIFAKSQGMSDSASMGLTFAMIGAATAGLGSKFGCSKRCAQ